MKVGDLIRIIKTGEVLVYLGMDDVGCYEFWHHKWQKCHFNPDTFPPEKWEVINESR
jgi:hypothetical protein